jgi:hypothetical protein
MRKKTPAQQWQWERRFHNKGSIFQMEIQARRLLYSETWTKAERLNLEVVKINLGLIRQTYDNQTLVLERKMKGAEQ